MNMWGEAHRNDHGNANSIHVCYLLIVINVSECLCGIEIHTS